MPVKVSKSAARSGPLWQGPEGEGPNGGITQSMLSRWLECRERFRVRYIEGWRANDQFNKYLEYGQLWHVCEEAHAAGGGEKGPEGWPSKLLDYVRTLIGKYPLQQEEIDHWYRTCKAQFPVYIEYWSKHRDVEQRTPLMQEQVFDVPYQLPNGRIVRLRGKFDSVDLIKKHDKFPTGVWLMENKTKGDVDRQQIESQLQFDLQTMTYIIALQGVQYDPSTCKVNPDVPTDCWITDKFPILGVRYNVVRRPFSGGKGSIKRREPSKSNPKGETKDEFYLRLQTDYFRTEPEYWFQRWKSEVSPEDVTRFRRECLDPILEQMCQWYEHIYKYGVEIARGRGLHWRHPFGVRNSIDEGYGSDVDNFITTGSTVGLTKSDSLFSELQP